MASGQQLERNPATALLFQCHVEPHVRHPLDQTDPISLTHVHRRQTDIGDQLLDRAFASSSPQ